MKVWKKVDIITCQRCKKSWMPKIDNPRYCALCKSPYYAKPRDKDRLYVNSSGGLQSSKYGFEKLEVGVPMTFPWIKDKDGKFDQSANERRGNALGQYMSRHGYHYSDLSHPTKGMIILRRT